MKRKCFVVGVLMLASMQAMAEQVLVTQGKGHQCRGDQFTITSPIEVLYPERECKLPLANKNGWMAYRFQGDKVQRDGCFAKQLDGSYTIIREDNTHQVTPSNGYVMARLSTDGKATVLASPNQDTPYAKAMAMCP